MIHGAGGGGSGGGGGIPGSIIVLTGSRALSASDNGQTLVYSGTSAISLTIPSGLPNGFTCTVWHDGSNGSVSAGAGAGVTLRQAFNTYGRGTAFTIKQVETDVYAKPYGLTLKLSGVQSGSAGDIETLDLGTGITASKAGTTASLSASAPNIIYLDTALSPYVSDARADLIAAFTQAALTTPPSKVVAPPGYYKVSDEIHMDGISIDFEGYGATFRYDNTNTGTMFRFTNPLGSEQAVSSVTNWFRFTTQSVGAKIFTDPTGWAVRDVLKLTSDDTINKFAFPVISDPAERQAEYGVVRQVNVDNLVIDKVLYFTYTTNIRCCKMDANQTINVRGITMTSTNPAAQPSSGIGGMSINGFMRPFIDDLYQIDFPGPCLSIFNCYGRGGYVGTVSCKYMRGDTSHNQVGYGVNVSSSQGLYIDKIIVENIRHGFTSNATDIAENSTLDNYGGCVDITIGLIHAVNNTSFAFDTHTDAYNVHCETVIVRQDWQELGELAGGIQFRGVKASFGHLNFNGTGTGILIGVAAQYFHGGKITGTHQQTFQGGIDEDATNYPDGHCIIDEIDVQPSYGTVLFKCTGTFGGRMEIGRLRVRVQSDFMPQTGLAYTIFQYAPLAGTTKLRISDFYVDFLACTDSLPSNAWTIVSATNTIAMDSMVIEHMTIDYAAITDSRTIKIFQQSNGNFTNGAIIKVLDLIEDSEAPSTYAASIMGTSANVTLSLSGTVRGANGNVRNFGDYNRSISSSSTTVTHLGTQYDVANCNIVCLAPTLKFHANVTNANARISVLQPPAYDGQQWFLDCVPGSANPLVINSNQVVNSNGNITCNANQVVVLQGVSGAWNKLTFI